MLIAFASILVDERLRRTQGLAHTRALCGGLRTQLVLARCLPGDPRFDARIQGYLSGVVAEAAGWAAHTWLRPEHVVLEGYAEIFADFALAAEQIIASRRLRGTATFDGGFDVGQSDTARAQRAGTAPSQLTRWLRNPEGRDFPEI